MADLDENLRTFLLADSTLSAITNSVHINRVPDNKRNPYVWIQTTDRDSDLCLDGASGPALTTFDIEATSTELDKAKDMQTAIRNRLQGYTGSFGDQAVAFVRIDSIDDSYISRQQFGDQDDYHIAALTCCIGTDSRI